MLGLTLLKLDRPADAEPPLRECLAIRDKKFPNLWPRYSTMSMLGAGHFMGQKKYQDAEPLLIQGYDGLKSCENEIPALARFNLKDAGARMIQLYEAWGKADKAAEWRKKLEPAQKP